MKKNRVITNRVKTNIEELDDLLYGGLHLHPDTGTVIALRGVDAIHKLQFSMHLMYGISMSLQYKEPPYFFSISKDTASLEDIYTDFQISNALYSCVINTKNNFPYEKIFERDSSNNNIKAQNDNNQDFAERIRNGYYHYNPRTQHIHKKDDVNGDSEKNELYKRNWDPQYSGDSSPIQNECMLKVVINPHLKKNEQPFSNAIVSRSLKTAFSSSL